jgi:hypothetical protein
MNWGDKRHTQSHTHTNIRMCQYLETCHTARCVWKEHGRTLNVNFVLYALTGKGSPDTVSLSSHCNRSPHSLPFTFLRFTLLPLSISSEGRREFTFTCGPNPHSLSVAKCLLFSLVALRKTSSSELNSCCCMHFQSGTFIYIVFVVINCIFLCVVQISCVKDRQGQQCVLSIPSVTNV